MYTTTSFRACLLNIHWPGHSSMHIQSLLARGKFGGCVHCLCTFGSGGGMRGLIEIGTVLSWSLLIGWELSPRQLGLIVIQLVRLWYKTRLRYGMRRWNSHGWKGKVAGKFGEMNFDGERGAGSRGLFKFWSLDSIGERSGGIWRRGVVRREGFGVSEVSKVGKVGIHSLME